MSVGKNYPVLKYPERGQATRRPLILPPEYQNRWSLVRAGVVIASAVCVVYLVFWVAL